ncbi:DUF2061 domain-containing protein [Sulfitobacter mediterraneus]|jgi:uncharacterized membrane protein|uniref:DUF2061 domain-containing protein n=1 Tax=Sulfitobacter TaxID=60136 RepID=UPI0019317FCA|nr:MULTISPECIES: DUF2061 domain-containing protein [Sulfitobacter]MBM1633114.1 DUF2061 domain-containing protein [Sulfitobacter mediterraneus]MBM1640752.1 DUF2061 domain-containing protein [Sulfitobacter mediterraneus]MBM1644979.1 DUF2061 domain-containing protein [Sulfitobacter mediterraneus]MBM1648872.1 DUF2061 domain-containing protein [Sulfitobacter mediterraneus]MBM1652893.1 DUF2061 domain-containing protein [Sulfitobacter mediterraneus]
MQHPKRTIAKALTWQTSGLLMMVILGYLTTGSIRAAGGLALASFATGTVTYFIHERIWDRIRWGQILPKDQVS